jgi:hypothetical protein
MQNALTMGKFVNKPLLIPEEATVPVPTKRETLRDRRSACLDQPGEGSARQDPQLTRFFHHQLFGDFGQHLDAWATKLRSRLLDGAPSARIARRRKEVMTRHSDPEPTTILAAFLHQTRVCQKLKVVILNPVLIRAAKRKVVQVNGRGVGLRPQKKRPQQIIVALHFAIARQKQGKAGVESKSLKTHLLSSFRNISPMNSFSLVVWQAARSRRGLHLTLTRNI